MTPNTMRPTVQAMPMATPIHSQLRDSTRRRRLSIVSILSCVAVKNAGRGSANGAVGSCGVSGASCGAMYGRLQVDTWLTGT